MPTFDELVKFVEYCAKQSRRVKERKALQADLARLSAKAKAMTDSFNAGIEQLSEADKLALRLSLMSAMKDMLTTYLSFMRSERGIQIPDWL